MDLIKIKSTRPFSGLQRPDMIFYQSEQVPPGNYIVYDNMSDLQIPVVMVQLWRFIGGYDHAIFSVVLNDLAINTSIKILKPRKIIAKVDKILNYRGNNTTISEKEHFILDIYPSELSEEQDEEFPYPFMCKLLTEDGSIKLPIPDWTPIQNLPLDKIGEGSIVEVWVEGNEYSIMKVVKV